jgi:hypothetical protein
VPDYQELMIVKLFFLVAEEWVMPNITKANAVNDVRPVLANICTSSPSWVIDWIIRKLVDFLATSDDNIALFEFGFHIVISFL